MSTDAPLSSLSPAQIRLLTFQILTEHFTWSPETLVKLGMDCANHTLTSIIDNDVEPYIQQHFAAAYALQDGQAVDPGTGLNGDELEKGLVQLETLLESAIDKRFDLFELYLLRNIFTIPVDLLPYLELSHQAHLNEALRGEDKVAIAEYEKEAQLYEEELAKERELACTAEFVTRKLERVQARQDEIGYLKQSDSLSSDSAGLVAQVSLLQSRLSTLLDTPQPATLPTPPPSDGVQEPWAESRSAFINWVASSKVAALGRGEGGGGKAEDAGLAKLQERSRQVGRGEDAQALLRSLQ